MAFIRALETVHAPSQRLFADPFAEAFLSLLLGLLASGAHRQPIRDSLSLLIRSVFAGPYADALVRIRYIDDVVENSKSLNQLVILGAGYDSRPYRLMRLPMKRVFELDRPPILERKHAVITRVTGKVPSNVTFVACDLALDEFPSALISSGFDCDAPALFLWEGVTNYLSRMTVESTLSGLATVAATGSRLVMTYADARFLNGSRSEPGVAQLFWLARLVGERVRFGMDPEEVPRYLAIGGFRSESNLSTRDISRFYCKAQTRLTTFGASRIALAVREPNVMLTKTEGQCVESY